MNTNDPYRCPGYCFYGFNQRHFCNGNFTHQCCESPASAFESNDAEFLSRKKMQSLWVCNMVAGNRLLTGFSRLFFTASALRLSGTVQIIFADFMICFTDMLIALRGTESSSGNHPSPICCFLQASSSSTTR